MSPGQLLAQAIQIYFLRVSVPQLNSETWLIKLNPQKWTKIYQISPQYWQQNQQQQALLLRYFALPLKEDEHHLWLAVDSLNNLAACETFAFLSGKLVEPILFETAQLKQLLQSLAPKANQIEEQTTFYHHSEDESTANLSNEDRTRYSIIKQYF